jgi:hypothetical protein
VFGWADLGISDCPQSRTELPTPLASCPGRRSATNSSSPLRRQGAARHNPLMRKAWRGSAVPASAAGGDRAQAITRSSIRARLADLGCGGWLPGREVEEGRRRGRLRRATAGREGDTEKLWGDGGSGREANIREYRGRRLRIEGRCAKEDRMPSGIGQQFSFPISCAPKRWNCCQQIPIPNSTLQYQLPNGALTSSGQAHAQL